MSLAGLQDVVRPYEGSNRSHRKFRANYKYLNALYYLIVSGRQCLRTHLAKELAKAEAEANPKRGFALGVVTDVISQTEISAVTVSGSDLRDMIDDFGGFTNTVERQSIIGAHRLFVDYAVDLLNELLDKNLVVLASAKEQRIRSRYLSPKELYGLYRDLRLPISSKEDEDKQLRWLSALRNALEHNDGLAGDEFIKLTAEQGLSVGDRIPVGSREAGYALAIVEHAAASLNRRVLEKWPSLAACDT